MRDIGGLSDGRTETEAAPWGEDNDGSVGRRLGGFELLAADGLD